jgi:hypothetical protein
MGWKWYDTLGTALTGGAYLGGKYALDKGFRNDVNNFANKRPGAPSMPSNPYQGQWDSLIGQLQQGASGNGPSLAGEAFKEANQKGMQNVLSMSRGGTAGATRMGQQQLGQMNQGMAQGYSNARLQEMLANRQMLQGALGGAGQAWFQPQWANMQGQMGTPTNFQNITGFLQQLLSAGGTIAGAK